MSDNIVFVVECESCEGEFTSDYFIEVCKGCRNKCRECRKKAVWNYEDYSYGIKCGSHKDSGMVNIQNKEYAERRFIKNIRIMGGTVVGEYINCNTPVECKCPSGHPCRPCPTSIQQGGGMCRVCTGRDSATARESFYNRIRELGGTVVGEYRGVGTPVECKCPSGHTCRPRPNKIQQGGGMCRVCAGNDPATAREAFYNRIGELGGEVVGRYINANTPVECKCPAGHSCKPHPSSIQRGVGMCRVCVGLDPATAKEAFYNRIRELGGTVVGDYINTNTPVECKCPAGHPCRPYPKHIQQDVGMCRVCVGLDQDIAREAFYNRIGELGGTVTGEYINNNTPVECKCPTGHTCRPRPNKIQQGRGMCRVCAGQDPATAKEAFYNRIGELGGTVVGEYRGANTPVECKCPAGHPCRPRPGNIRQGGGMCRRCKQSLGEMYISRVLELLDIPYGTEVYADNCNKKYRYDFSFKYREYDYYLEFDGIQHFEYIPFFHSTEKDFYKRRQVDLYKNYLAKKSGKKIVRISYLQIEESVEYFSFYLEDLLDRCKSDIVVDCSLYEDWVHLQPDMEVIESIDDDTIIDDDDYLYIEDEDIENEIEINTTEEINIVNSVDEVILRIDNLTINDNNS